MKTIADDIADVIYKRFVLIVLVMENKINNFIKTNDPKFNEACKKVGLPPTKRQASKWLMQKGKAYKEGRET